MDELKLRECPFCGGEAEVSYGTMGDTKMPYIECLECAACSDFCLTVEEAIALWNRRFEADGTAK